MKKITLFLILAVLCGLTYGQYTSKTMDVNKDYELIKTSSEFSKTELNIKNLIWENDFSTPEDWTIEAAEGTDGAVWVITTYDDPPAGWFPVYGMNQQFASTTVDNGFAVFNSDIQGGAGGDPQDSWIQYVNTIDFSGIAGTPRLVFETYYAKWEDEVFFEFSTDEGTTWTQIPVLTEVEAHASNATDPDYVYAKTIPELTGLDDVLIRFRFTGDWDYGWFIDDVKFVEAPDYDIRVTDSRMNFFDYVDYSEPGQADYFHLSGHYTMIPAEQFNSMNAICWFNVTVQNSGLLEIVPEINVKIYDPSNAIIFDETVVGATLGFEETDTIDFFETPNFQLGADPATGLYTVEYTATIQGEEVELDLNKDYAHFWVTENTFSYAGTTVSGGVSPSHWLSGGNDGDMIGVTFLYLFEAELETVDVFIHSASDPETSFLVRILEHDGEDWFTVTSSMLTMVEEEHLGTWVNVPLISNFPIDFEGEDFKNIMVAVEFYFGDGGLWIGADETNNQSFWAATWNFSDDPGWGSISNWVGRGLCIRANTGTPFIDPVNIDNDLLNNISIYPNPSSGIINIENAEGASIEIFNLMGQSITKIDNAFDFHTVDISSFADGTYIVRIVKDNKVHTHKINLID